MNLSSILVYTSPDNVEVLQKSLCALPGIEVHHLCHDTGRLVVIQEAIDDNTEMDGLQSIKALPFVMAADMFYHYVEKEFGQETQESPQQNTAGGALSWV
jgi:nitrate reductase NapD